MSNEQTMPPAEEPKARPTNVDQPNAPEAVEAMKAELAGEAEAAEKAGFKATFTPAGHLRVDL